MLMVLVVVAVVSGALVLGAAWGLFWPMPQSVQGFLVALAGGALIVSVVSELIEPSLEESGAMPVLAFVGLGAIVFTVVDHLVDEVWGGDSGGGLLVAITLDGIPENLALGVALITAEPLQVAALAGSILLSNLPEAAGGARQMADDGRSPRVALGLWGATALLLSGAAIAGYLLLEGASTNVLGSVRGFAAGAVVASLATEVFPEAYRQERDVTGLAATLGVVLAVALGQLGS